MSQLKLPGTAVGLDKPTNVSSVPQRSPFRYPGGKTWLVPRIRQWLTSRPTPPELLEPFAGGGIVGLTAAAEGLAHHVTFVELDQQVAAVWQVLVNGEGPELGDRIMGFEPTVESVRAEIAKPANCALDQAFQTIVKNRTFHGGILAPGSAPIKHGENGKGITSRWYPETLRKRLLAIDAMRDRLAIICGDGIEVMREYAQRGDAAVFIDPPYTAAGKKAGRRLYAHFELDHEELFRVTDKLTGDFLMTYDDADGVRALAAEFGFDTEVVAMRNTHLTAMTELLIARDLDWLRCPP